MAEQKSEEALQDQEQQPTLELYSSNSEGIGSILINPDVIARIAAMAAQEVEGISLISKFSLAGKIFGGSESARGIRVDRTEEGRYTITCEVNMAYGTPMRETAEQLQRHVRETVERMAGLELANVDVKIVDIFVQKEKQDEEEEN